MRTLLLKAAIGLLAGAASGLVVGAIFPQIAGETSVWALTGAVALAGLIGAVVEELLERLWHP